MNIYRAGYWKTRVYMLGWIIFIACTITFTIKAHEIYLSEENNCQKYDDTFILLIFLLACMYVSLALSIFFTVFSIYLLVLTIIWYCNRHIR